jgi:hypothetical protein
MKELETERDHLAEETIRLRLALEDEQARRTSLKAYRVKLCSNVHGVNSLEHKVQFYTEKNGQLQK